MSQFRTLPARGQLLPDISGTLAGGNTMRISEFRGRKNLVLIFSGRQPDACPRETIHALASRYHEVCNENAEVIAVLAPPAAEAARIGREIDLPFPVVSDEHMMHRTAGAVDAGGNPMAAVCIADRYGEVYSAEFCAAGCLSADDILDWLRFIEIQCPECGVSEWPRADS